ncbi:MAG: PhoH family protein [Pseudomonadota bacterium]|nr:PhoH family protein [Pseudomonadota bacterium]
MDTQSIELTPYDNEAMRNLLSDAGYAINEIKEKLSVDIAYRGNQFFITGEPIAIDAARGVLVQLFDEASQHTLNDEHIHLAIRSAQSQLAEQKNQAQHGQTLNANTSREIILKTPKSLVKARTENQKRYLQNVMNHDFNFAIGPAGTGKTWLAMALAVDAFERQLVDKILLVRPAVEAGEKLGFLPGDMEDKVNPYLRPLYDALHDLVGEERLQKMTERNIIEIAPLAFMRGRTLNKAFIILDESQNTTVEQMKMFLTRIGFGSKAVVTGDPSQIDLPRGVTSGLSNAIEVLNGVEGISFSYFKSHDVVRHPTVQKIIDAYDRQPRL